MYDDKRNSMSEMFQEAFAKVTNKDVEKYQKEKLNDFFLKVTESLEIDIHDKYQEVIGDDLSDAGMNKSISIAFMEGKASITDGQIIVAKAYPEAPLQDYSLHFGLTLKDLFDMDSYVELHKKCKELDVDLMVNVKEKSADSMSFSMVVIMNASYGAMKTINPRAQSNALYPPIELMDENYVQEETNKIGKDPKKISFGGGN